MQSIDMVITYVDENDLSWQKDYNKYKKREIKKGITKENNKQAFGKERIRNWDNLKYWFRGVENNCSWINKIFFICQKPSQIPKWLDKNNPRLKIIFHKDFIPKELLPTFSGMTIAAFIPLIEELSDLYLYCDDDIFFLNPIPETRLFNNNMTKQKDNPFWGWGPFQEHLGQWGRNLENTYELEKQYGGPSYRYAPYHLPNPYQKSITKKALKDNWDAIIQSLKVSKFRNEKNICPTEFYTNVIKRTNSCIIDNHIFDNSIYVTLKSSINFDDYENKEMVCFNDTEAMDNFELVKEKLDNFLEKKLPNKSSFEKGE